MIIDTRYRPDGNFLIQLFCKQCAQEYFVSAWSADSGKCWRCDEVAELEALLRQ
jgi:hypothetical protein